ncbi:MAG: hypothetical protein U9N42_00920 [Campylobacterota bacterium]|nr:hypothetical protein [Campylobacterota bacterium]
MRQNLADALIVPQEVLTKQIVASHFTLRALKDSKHRDKRV